MRAIALLVLVACGSAALGPGGYEAWNLDPRGKEVMLGAGDVLQINVWDQKELNTEATIRPDGTITIPLVGDIKASGHTPSVLRDKIKAALVNYVKLGGTNEITVAVKAWKSYRFTVQGEVSRPGVYTSDEYLTVSDAIALAGGPTRFGRRNAMVLMRKGGDGKTSSVPLDYDLIASGKRPDMNLWIWPGDVIYVP